MVVRLGRKFLSLVHNYLKGSTEGTKAATGESNDYFWVENQRRVSREKRHESGKQPVGQLSLRYRTADFCEVKFRPEMHQSSVQSGKFEHGFFLFHFVFEDRRRSSSRV